MTDEELLAKYGVTSDVTPKKLSDDDILAKYGVNASPVAEPQEEPGFFESAYDTVAGGVESVYNTVGEMITGKERFGDEMKPRVSMMDSAITGQPVDDDNWYDLPELKELSGTQVLANLLTSTTVDSEQRAQVITSLFPNVKVGGTDKKGNIYFTRGDDPKKYWIKPGSDLGDLGAGLMAKVPLTGALKGAAWLGSKVPGVAPYATKAMQLMDRIGQSSRVGAKVLEQTADESVRQAAVTAGGAEPRYGDIVGAGVMGGLIPATLKTGEATLRAIPKMRSLIKVAKEGGPEATNEIKKMYNDPNTKEAIESELYDQGLKYSEGEGVVPLQPEDMNMAAEVSNFASGVENAPNRMVQATPRNAELTKASNELDLDRPPTEYVSQTTQDIDATDPIEDWANRIYQSGSNEYFEKNAVKQLSRKAKKLFTEGGATEEYGKLGREIEAEIDIAIEKQSADTDKLYAEIGQNAELRREVTPELTIQHIQDQKKGAVSIEEEQFGGKIPQGAKDANADLDKAERDLMSIFNRPRTKMQTVASSDPYRPATQQEVTKVFGPTYGTLLETKKKLNAVIRHGQVYDGFQQGRAKHLAGLVAKDIENIETKWLNSGELSQESVDLIRKAKDSVIARKEIEEGMDAMLGSNHQKELSRQLTTLMKGAAEGDYKKFASLVKILPKGDRGRELLMSAFQNAAKMEGDVGAMAAFGQFHRKIKTNSQAMASIASIIGPKNMKNFKNIGTIAEAIDNTQSSKKRAGAANSMFLSTLVNQKRSIFNSFMQKTISTITGNKLAQGVTMLPGMEASALGVALGMQTNMQSVLSGSELKRLEKAIELVTGPETTKLMRGDLQLQDIKDFSRKKKILMWANQVGLARSPKQLEEVLIKMSRTEQNLQEE